ncbi:MAG: CopG family transcriptional regulator [Candidatus Omnitrophica bacterium]|nr:CopG family transcriptional regulator [Candidatus Omnitrophota bacterium]
MMTSSINIPLDSNMEELLDALSQASGKTPAEIATEALKRYLRLQRFEDLRKKAMPFAEARGYLTDEDVFREVS